MDAAKTTCYNQGMKLFIATLIAALAALVAAGWSWDGDRLTGMSDGGQGGFRLANVVDGGGELQCTPGHWYYDGSRYWYCVYPGNWRPQ